MFDEKYNQNDTKKSHAINQPPALYRRNRYGRVAVYTSICTMNSGDIYLFLKRVPTLGSI